MEKSATIFELLYTTVVDYHEKYCNMGTKYIYFLPAFASALPRTTSDEFAVCMTRAHEP